jgi:hypothetical protein
MTGFGWAICYSRRWVKAIDEKDRPDGGSSMNSKHEAIINRFGAAVAELHERQVWAAKRRLEQMASPETDHNRVMSNYYSRMDRDQLLIAWAQTSIEDVLHDFFFLFAENEDFKLVLEAEDGTRINLADAVDEMQAFPLEWIERKSDAGLEISRQLEFLEENLPRETDQERRARTIRERAQRSDDQA